MEELTERIKKLVNSDPNKPLTPFQIALIEEQIRLAFPVRCIPTHPTYASMIQTAIEKLNEEGGSNKESISKYIKANYDDLPWAHDTYLTHHLNNLCINGEIGLNPKTNSYFYVTPARAGLQDRSSSKKQKRGRKPKENVIHEKEAISGGVYENGDGLRGNLIGSQEVDIEVYGRSKVKYKRQCSVNKDDEEIGEQKSEGFPLENGFECVEYQNHPLTVKEKCKGECVGDDTSVKDLVLNETPLMIVPKEGNNFPILVENSGMNSISERMCEIPEQEKELKSSSETISKMCQRKWKISFKGMTKRFKANSEKKEVSKESTSTFPKSLGLDVLETKVSGLESEMGPPWLIPMLKCDFFSPCSVHKHSTKNEKNIFCLDCIVDAFCLHCLSNHNKDHRCVRLRRSNYMNAVRVNDIWKHLDISHIQPYIVNSLEVLHLNARPRPKNATRMWTHPCEICGHNLNDSFRFCSLACKLRATVAGTTKFMDSPVDQSHQDSSMEGGLDQSERHKFLEFSVDQSEAIFQEQVGKEDLVPLSNEHVQLQDMISNPATSHDMNLCLWQEGPPDLPKEDARGRMQKPTDGTEEDAEPSSALRLPLQKRSYKSSTDQHSQQPTKVRKKDDRERSQTQLGLSSKKQFTGTRKKARGRPRKSIEPVVDDAVVSSKLDIQQPAEESLPVTLQIPLQVEKRKKAGQGKPRKQKEGTNENATASKILQIGEQETQSESTIYPGLQKLKKKGRGRPKKREGSASTGNPTTPMKLHIRHNIKIKKNSQRRQSKQKDINEDELEMGPSDQGKQIKTEICLGLEAKQSNTEVQNLNPSNETGILMPITSSEPSNVIVDHQKEYQQPDVLVEPEKVHKTDETGVAVPPLDEDKQDDRQAQQQEVLHCPELKSGDSEGQVTPVTKKSIKATAIRVPLSSKDQLRSRINRQSLD
ncbi:uncharacterized protein LOC130825147 [Amaranthus tricolor]|uniref:uncharacterized protein LOC130825147 n=1 Tax=Amaranthus tricolor TaxID=29722 RepID=UPI002583657B|nr:uncharacterized protein LOC130825147 [Amaranthus tricolor]